MQSSDFKRDCLAPNVQLLLRNLDMTVTDVASAAGCTPSNLNRIKNGVRTPPMTSPTVRKLVHGVIILCHQRGLLPVIEDLLHSPSKGDLETQLLEWLYTVSISEGESSVFEKNKALPVIRKQSVPLFGTRLDQLMRLTDMSNGVLSRATGMSPSYISRLRRGQRLPKYSSRYLDGICKTLLETVYKKELLEELTDLMGIPKGKLTEETGMTLLRDWLFDYQQAETLMTTDILLETIRSISELLRTSQNSSAGTDRETNFNRSLTFSKRETARSESVDYYRGTEGLQTAVIRFLQETPAEKGQRLLLYSDQSMNWMGGNFAPLLTSLMAGLIRGGVQITIIHNVERSISELIDAIRLWLPLYMTGQITSYYSTESAGEQFSHSLFLCPGHAAITSMCVRGEEKAALSCYHSSDETLSTLKEEFDLLLKGAKPLITVCNDVRRRPGDLAIEDLLIRSEKGQVTIKRTTEPLLSFRFTHPSVFQAFRSLLQPWE